MSQIWLVPNNHTMPIIGERQPTSLQLPTVYDPNLEIKIVSGTLPPGLRLENNMVKGVAFEVALDRLYPVVVRAEIGDEFDDRTLNFIVTGADNPQWVTNAGLLPVGNNNAFFILDNSPIDFQLIATDLDTLDGEKLEYFIGDNEGVLPPGITLTKDGKLTGIVEPLLSLDKLYQDGGYDVPPYSALTYDYGIDVSDDYQFLYDELIDNTTTANIRNRRKLNRYYPFTVTVTDRDNFVKRDFNIYVVGDDFLTADNTVMQVSTGVFTADNTNIRTPIWITPRDLGYKRANNYTSIFLETINNSSLTGFVYYTLENTNDDNSISQLPPGISLDNKTGTLTGKIPYQPAVTKTYKFTVRATRFADITGVTEIVGIFAEDTKLGNLSFKIEKTNSAKDLNKLINQEINIEGNLYRVLAIDTTNPTYDLITLSQTLSPVLSLSLSRASNGLSTEIFVNRVSESERIQIIGKQLIFSGIESYTIIDAINQGTETRITVDKTIRAISLGTNIGFALFKGKLFRALVSDNARDSVNTPYKSKTFELKVIGEVESEIQWITDSQLGEIAAEFVSTFSVEAKSLVFENILTYSLVDGSLPNNLSLNYKGEIVGKVNQYAEFLNASTDFGNTWDDSTTVFDGIYNLGLTKFDNKITTWDNNTTFDRKFSFTVKAEDQLLASSTKEFFINVLDTDPVLYTNIYFKPLLKIEQRELYYNFVSNNSIFDYKLIYRQGDPNFGIQPDLKMLVYAGIEAEDIEKYIDAVQINHVRKKFYLGNFKKAVAKNPGSNRIIYEVIYIEVMDPYQLDQDKTRKSYTINSTDSNDQIRYISNIGNMRDNIKEIGSRQRNYLPLWMRTPQENYQIFNYKTAVPVCYCLPGTADQILLNIKNYSNTTGFSIQQVNFDVDRYIIERTAGNNNEQFVLFPNYKYNI